jgi:hypothetical protein
MTLPRAKAASCAPPGIVHGFVSLPSAPFCVTLRTRLQKQGSRFLVELCDCGCFRSKHRFGGLANQELFERQAAVPARPKDPYP